MGNPVSQKIWTISSPLTGNKRLRRVKSYTITDEGDTEAVNAVGEDRPIGFKDKVGGITIEFDYYFEEGKGEVDWRKLLATKTSFTLVSQDAGAGERLQYQPCRVGNVAGDGDDEGSHMGKVKIVALGRDPL